MPVVSDSSPLVLYAAIGRLELLRDLFGEVVIPPAVRSEVVDAGKGRPGEREVAGAPWIRELTPGRSPAAHGLPEELDAGEAETIALGLESSEPVLVLIDDRAGRRIALERGIPTVGSAGILVLAKRRGYIAALRPLLDQLREAGLYVSDAVYVAVIGESSEPLQG